MYRCIFSDACIEPPLDAAVPTPNAPRKRLSACTCAHPRGIGGAAEHNGPRRIEARPSASAIVRADRAGPEAAHTPFNEVTDAVFHAPMFALKANAAWNACVPKPHAVDADGKGSHGLGLRVLGRARSTSPPTRAHTADPSPSQTGARIHLPDRFSHVHTKWMMYV
jgi:hypothetical protein